jgi:hypothetical protein
MSLRSVISGLVLLPMLSSVVGCVCGDRVSNSHGTIIVRLSGERGLSDLGVEHCEETVDPDGILKSITIRDPEGTEVASVSVRGRDATVKEVGANPRSCSVTAVKRVPVPQEGLLYEITADGKTYSLGDWPGEYQPLGHFESCRSFYEYSDTRSIYLHARGWALEPIVQTGRLPDPEPPRGHRYPAKRERPARTEPPPPLRGSGVPH